MDLLSTAVSSEDFAKNGTWNTTQAHPTIHNLMDKHPLDPPLHYLRVPLQYQFPLHSLPALSLLGKIGKDPHPPDPRLHDPLHHSLHKPNPHLPPYPPLHHPPHPLSTPNITASPQIPIPLSTGISLVNTTIKFNPPKYKF